MGIIAQDLENILEKRVHFKLWQMKDGKNIKQQRRIIKMEEFKIGDEVVVISCGDGLEGATGKVVHEIDSGMLGVEFYRIVGDLNCKLDGHSCNGDGSYGYCWWVKPDDLKKTDKPIEVDKSYDSLKNVLQDAAAQSESGKGRERHANNNKYEDQVICVVQRLLQDHPFGGHAYQIIKKTIEAGRLYKIKGKEAAYQEILGAINYCAAMNILIKED